MDDYRGLIANHLNRRELNNLRASGVLDKTALKKLRRVGIEEGPVAAHKLLHELIAGRPLAIENDEFPTEEPHDEG